MTVHLPLLFVILAVGAVSLIVAYLVGGVLTVWAFMHMDSGPGWYGKLPIPGAVIAFCVTAYFAWGLT